MDYCFTRIIGRRPFGVSAPLWVRVRSLVVVRVSDNWDGPLRVYLVRGSQSTLIWSMPATVGACCTTWLELSGHGGQWQVLGGCITFSGRYNLCLDCLGLCPTMAEALADYGTARAVPPSPQDEAQEGGTTPSPERVASPAVSETWD